MKIRISSIITAATIGFASVAAASPGHDHGKEEPKKEEPKKGDDKVKPYKLETCSVSGDKLGELGRPVVFE